MTRFPITLLSVAALGLGVAACGGSSSSSSSSAATSAPAASTTSSQAAAAAPGSGGGASSTLAIAANSSGALMFSKTTLTAKAGTVTIKFTNTSPEGHNFTIQSPAGATVGATPTFSGGSKTLTVKLKPGKYTFLCTVPGHEAGGMKGTLTVT